MSKTTCDCAFCEGEFGGQPCDPETCECDGHEVLERVLAAKLS